MKMNHYIGIDFGTSNSSVAYVCDTGLPGTPPPEPSLVAFPKADGSGDPRLPSMVGQVKDNRKNGQLEVGWEFMERMWQKATQSRAPKTPLLRQGNTLFRSVKSDLGDSRVYPFTCNSSVRTPEDATAIILRGMMEEARLSNPALDPSVSPVVLSVPASLSAEARKETLAALARIGMTGNISLIDEPIAALLHALSNPEAAAQLCGSRPSQVIVFDYGGGTLDLCLVECRRDQAALFGFTVKHRAISRYRRNGGNDIDAAIMRSVLWPQVEAQLKIPRKAIRADLQRSIEDTLTCFIARPLKEMVCQKTERLLNRNGGDWDEVLAGPAEIFRSPLRFEHPEIPKGLKIDFTLSPRQFHELMQPFLAVPDGTREGWESRYPQSLFLPIFDTLDKARLDVAQLDAVLLHGGAIRNPWILRTLTAGFSRKDLFAHARLVRTPNLNTSVAQGAALACYWRHARATDPVRPIIAEEIGIMDAQGNRITLVPAGEALPYPNDHDYWQTGKDTFFVPQDETPFMVVPWYTGKRASPSHYVKLDLSGCKQMVRGEAVSIHLRLDVDKVLHWQYDIGGRGSCDAECIEDPWLLHAPSPEQRTLASHRRWMKQWALAHPDQPIMADMIATEANLCRLASDYVAAETLCYEYVDHFGEAPGVLNCLSIICHWTARPDLAVQYSARAAALAPAEAVFIGNYGYFMADAGLFEEGEKKMREALAMDPDLAYLHERLGRLYRDTGRQEEAVALFSRGLSLLEAGGLAGKDQNDLSLSAQLYRHLGQPDKADESDRQYADRQRQEIVGGNDELIIKSYRSMA
jgi:hypothetical protein